MSERKEVHLNARMRAARMSLVAAVREALQAHAGSDCRLVLCLDPGEYEIDHLECETRFCAISNHDSARYAVAFDFSGQRKVNFRAEGARFVFRGRLIPFWLENANEIELSGFSVDWRRPFMTQAEVTDVLDENRVRLSIDPEAYPYKVECGAFIFHDHMDYRSRYLKNALEWEPQARRVAPQALDNWSVRSAYNTEQGTNPSKCDLSADFAQIPSVGNCLVLQHERRTSPAIVISCSREICLSDLTLFHAGGMGVIAQMSANLRLHRIKVAPNRDAGRIFSLCADASHFVECDGGIELEQCDFSGQMDDSCNVHGVYLIPDSVQGVRLGIYAGHFQQKWVDYIAAGDRVRLVCRTDYQAVSGDCRVLSVQRQDPKHFELRLDRELSPPADAVLQVSSRAVHTSLRGCHFHNHRARGVLLGAPGNHLVEGCRFSEIPGNAIHSTCDASNWFESAPLDSLNVSDNIFTNCGYGRRPDPAVIFVAPAKSEGLSPDLAVQRGVSISGNSVTGNAPFICVRHTEPVVEANNRINGEFFPHA